MSVGLPPKIIAQNTDSLRWRKKDQDDKHMNIIYIYIYKWASAFLFIESMNPPGSRSRAKQAQVLNGAGHRSATCKKVRLGSEMAGIAEAWQPLQAKIERPNSPH